MFLLRYHHVTGDEKALELVEKTLDCMYRGGIFDHIGGGFSRYSTDRKWLIPHFEKMLYDNALLALTYLEAYKVTEKDLFADVAHRIFTYIKREMTSKQGSFFSAEDVDSEQEEGKFYLWTPDEVKEILGQKDGALFCKYFDITSKGNFAGKSIPNLVDKPPEAEDPEICELRKRMLRQHSTRTHPYKDNKILTAWNGLMIAAYAVGARVLEHDEYLNLAENAVEFTSTKLIRSDGRMLARFRDGEAKYLAYVDDYAFLTWGLIELYEQHTNPRT